MFHRTRHFAITNLILGTADFPLALPLSASLPFADATATALGGRSFERVPSPTIQSDLNLERFVVPPRIAPEAFRRLLVAPQNN